jgi:hypothetical protein
MSSVLKCLNAAADPNEHRQNLRNYIAKIFAQASVDEAIYGPKFPLSKIDEAIKDMHIDERMTIKGLLSQADLLDVRS